MPLCRGQVMFVCVPFCFSFSGAVELVAGFGMAYFRPCLIMIRGVMPPKAVTYSKLLIGT